MSAPTPKPHSNPNNRSTDTYCLKQKNEHSSQIIQMWQVQQ